MSATHRLTFVMTVALVLIAGILGAALLGTSDLVDRNLVRRGRRCACGRGREFHRHADCRSQ
jgi:hypothetical protein